jgi:hypothetical protein
MGMSMNMTSLRGSSKLICSLNIHTEVNFAIFIPHRCHINPLVKSQQATQSSMANGWPNGMAQGRSNKISLRRSSIFMLFPKRPNKVFAIIFILHRCSKSPFFEVFPSNEAAKGQISGHIEWLEGT